MNILIWKEYICNVLVRLPLWIKILSFSLWHWQVFSCSYLPLTMTGTHQTIFFKHPPILSAVFYWNKTGPICPVRSVITHVTPLPSPAQDSPCLYGMFSFFPCLFACFNQMPSHTVFLQNQCHLETICWSEFMAAVEWTQQYTGVVEHIS